MSQEGSQYFIIVDTIANGIGALAMAIMVWGVLVGVVELLRVECSRLRGADIRRGREEIRQDVGYYILISLEFLIAADVIRTIIHPTLMDLAVLGGIVAIRTIISYFLTREIQMFGERLEREEAAQSEDAQR